MVDRQRYIEHPKLPKLWWCSLIVLAEISTLSLFFLLFGINHLPYLSLYVYEFKSKIVTYLHFLMIAPLNYMPYHPINILCLYTMT